MHTVAVRFRWHSYGAIRCGLKKAEILRCGSVRFSDIRKPTVRFGAVIYPTGRFGAVFKNRKSYSYGPDAGFGYREPTAVGSV